MVTQQTLLELLEPAVEGLGYELLDVEYHSGNRLLRLYIDGPDGVGLDDCEAVSHEVSALLDVDDPIPERYSLEVSSPGEKRVLRKPKHFTDFAGSRVKVELKAMRAGRRRYIGRLIGIEGDEVVVQTDDEVVRIGMDSISKVRLAPESAAAQRGR